VPLAGRGGEYENCVVIVWFRLKFDLKARIPASVALQRRPIYSSDCEMSGNGWIETSVNYSSAEDSTYKAPAGEKQKGRSVEEEAWFVGLRGSGAAVAGYTANNARPGSVNNLASKCRPKHADTFVYRVGSACKQSNSVVPDGGKKGEEYTILLSTVRHSVHQKPTTTHHHPARLAGSAAIAALLLLVHLVADPFFRNWYRTCLSCPPCTWPFAFATASDQGPAGHLIKFHPCSRCRLQRPPR
jgi:hypothetical protein